MKKSYTMAGVLFSVAFLSCVNAVPGEGETSVNGPVSLAENQGPVSVGNSGVKENSLNKKPSDSSGPKGGNSAEDDLFTPKQDLISGGYVGAGLGGGVGRLSLSSMHVYVKGREEGYFPPDYIAGILKNGDSLSPSLSGFMSTFRMGYLWHLGNSCWALGVDLGGGLTVVRARFGVSVGSLKSLSTGAVNQLNTRYTNFRAIDKGNFDAHLRAGYVMGRVMPYLTLGWSIHRVTFNAVYEDFTSKKNYPVWYNCFVFGGGVDVKLTQNTIVGVWVASNVGAKTKINYPMASMFNDGDAAFFRSHSKISLVQMFFMAKYFFPTARSY